jgi:hypothetical protein
VFTNYFQRICIRIIQSPRNRQVIVLRVRASLNIRTDINAKTIAPIPNPISRLGQICPPNASTNALTDWVNMNEIGIPKQIISHGYLLLNSHIN